jgi:hypothetical protein
MFSSVEMAWHGSPGTGWVIYTGADHRATLTADKKLFKEINHSVGSKIFTPNFLAAVFLGVCRSHSRSGAGFTVPPGK